jgi:tetratricopeptide (TPR) repeat protein
MLSAAELHRRGLAAANAGHHAMGRSLFHRALTRDPDNETTARILLSLAHVEFELGGQHAAAVDLCQQALELKGIATNTRGLVYSQLGLLYMRAGDGRAALATFDEAIPLLDDQGQLATAYLNRGSVHVHEGEFTLARDDFLQAVGLSRAVGDRVQEAKAEHNVGCADVLAGNLVDALKHLDAARPVLSAMSPTYHAVCEQDRADALIAAGLFDDAADALQASARAFGSRRMRQRQAEAELALARILSSRSPREAATMARTASRRFREGGLEAWALRADAVVTTANIAADRTNSRTAEDALALAERLEAHRRIHDGLALRLQATRLLVRSKGPAAAAATLAETHVPSRAPLTIRILERQVKAELAQARGRTTTATRHIRRGLADLHEWQASFGSLDLQSSLVGHGRELALSGLALALADGRPEVVFEWSERARALAGRVAPVRAPADPQAAHDLTELRGLQGEIAKAEDSGRVPHHLRKHAEELRAEIRQRAWYDRGSGMVTEPETLRTVQGCLASDELVVSILAAEEQLDALVVTANDAEVIPLGKLAPVRALLDGMQADLDMAAAHLPGPMRQAVHGGLGQRLVQLSSLLVGPWERHVCDRRVVVVPSGALAGTPWTLLPDLAGRPITVPRSASEWVTSRDQTRRLRTAGFVAGPRVDRAHEEVKRAAQGWRSADVLVGEDVRADPVRELASHVDVFHVAAHGRHSADNPLFSGLELADGPWFGYDIDQVASIPSTVVLSACELGRSTVRWGEETIGMTVAWLHAGARCVIASPAMVDDDVACEVLAATHRQLAAGVSPADALAEAMSAAESGVAPFICFGSGW